MRSQNKLIIAERFNERAQKMNDWSEAAKGLFFCEVLFAEHGNIKNSIVLNHEEKVIFQTQKIALFDNF